MACGGTNDVVLPQECYAFDPKSSQWTFYANMTHSRLGGASVVSGGKDIMMWLIGGVGYKFWCLSKWPCIAHVDVYSPGLKFNPLVSLL